MRIALISDAHGNLTALDAVLADIEQAGVDRTVYLGDITVFGPQPHEAVRRLKTLGCPCITGNHDFNVLNLDYVRGTQSNVPRGMVEDIEWTAAQLDADDLAFLRTFQPRLEIALGDGKMLLCFHGTPDSNTELIVPTTPRDELDAKLGNYRATVLAGGHSHVNMIRPHRGMLVVNPGSVGMPFEQPPSGGRSYLLPWAEYGILTCEDGLLSVDLRRVYYDRDSIKQAARDNPNPYLRHWLDDWVEGA